MYDLLKLTFDKSFCSPIVFGEIKISGGFLIFCEP